VVGLFRQHNRSLFSCGRSLLTLVMKLTDANTRLIVDTYKRKRNGLLLTHALLGHEMVKDIGVLYYIIIITYLRFIIVTCVT
jgi:hypothetical protein